MNADHIAIFADNPESAAAHSELCSAIGERKTVSLYRAMLFDTLAVCFDIPRVDISVYYQPAKSLQHFEQLRDLFRREEESRSISAKAEKLNFCPQKGQSYFERLKTMMEESFQKGFKRVMIVNSACPELNSAIIKAGFMFLESNDMVIGPAFDGRFYVCGMSKPLCAAFEGISGDEPDLYSRMMANLTGACASVQELELSYMVNTPVELNQLIEDIERWRKIGDERTAVHTERFLRTLG